MNRRPGLALAAGLAALPMLAQSWDAGARAADAVSNGTGGKLRISVEFRTRYENRGGVNFGADPDQTPALIRTRFGMSYQPFSWLRITGMAQDSRAPLWGPNAPNTVRDQTDLHESYLELFPDRKEGFYFSAGRRMLNYGDSRLIGSPQWSNLSRTFDHARLMYRRRKAQFEILLVSPVKIRIGEFNRPELGDRVWGAYNAFHDVFRKTLIEMYVLRHDQNRPGGFTGGNTAAGTDRLGVNTFGFRMAGPMARGAQFSLEGALQNGKVGPAKHRAGAWFSGVSRRWTPGARPLDLSAEYKYASGTDDPTNTARDGTFDQLYPANHDKFGHQDLFGWRNLHSVRTLATLALAKGLAFNVMYNSYWLASARDALYNSAGKAIVRSAAGTAGRHIGQEADTFVTYKYQHLTLGAGWGYFFQGQFIRNTTPGVSPTYVYVFQTYSL